MDSSHHQYAMPPGNSVGNYRIVKVLGDGGFGITYLAKNIELGKSVAIKEYLPNEFAVRDGSTVMPKSSASRIDFKWGLDRFIEEGRILTKFKHRNIVRAHDLFKENGTAYLVMEYEDGLPLDVLLAQKGKLTQGQLLKVVLPIAEGLRHVHAAGFLHRDIKPANIFIRRSDESPVLLDFGAARQSLGDKTKTVIASSGYSPPEQYVSKGDQGAWTDIYALSSLCYRAIVGKAPLDALNRQRDVVRRREDPLHKLAEIGVDGYSKSVLMAVDWGMLLIESQRPQSIDTWVAMLKKNSPIDAEGDIDANGDAPDGEKKYTGSRLGAVGFITALCRGDFGLAQTYWVLGICVHVPMSAAWYALKKFQSIGAADPVWMENTALLLPIVFMAFPMLVFSIPYALLVMIGVWNAADKTKARTNHSWAKAAKFHVIAQFAWLLYFFTSDSVSDFLAWYDLWVTVPMGLIPVVTLFFWALKKTRFTSLGRTFRIMWIASFAGATVAFLAIALAMPDEKTAGVSASTRAQQDGTLTLTLIPDDAKVRFVSPSNSAQYRAGMQLPSGDYTLEISRTGYMTQTAKVVLRSGASTHSAIRLTPSPKPMPNSKPLLMVRTTPPNAKVEFVGSNVAYGRVGRQRGIYLAQGNYRIRVSAAGYASKVLSFQHGPDDTDLSVALIEDNQPTIADAEPAEWPFTVQTSPSDALVEIVGGGAAYRAGMLLAPGGYRVRVSAPMGVLDVLRRDNPSLANYNDDQLIPVAFNAISGHGLTYDEFRSRIMEIQRASKYEPKTMTVRHGSEPTRILVELDKVRQPFTVAATPANAQVHVEGESAYRAGMMLPWGEYRVRVSAPKYEAKTVTVRHGSGPTRASVALSKVRQPFTVATTPARAQVRIDGISASYRAGMLLPWGEYRVAVSAPGYKTVAVSIAHGVEPTRQRIVLERVAAPGPTRPAARARGDYFTRGSHSDDVLRLQGTPSDIERYDILGKEVWSYGRSTVEIDTRTGRVREWNNRAGNLKAKMLPGSNTTSAAYFTRGSHSDDVLRLQGTPSDIERYDILGKEVWSYGRSTVEIDTRTGRVREWNNRAGNLKAKLIPGGSQP